MTYHTMSSEGKFEEAVAADGTKFKSIRPAGEFITRTGRVIKLFTGYNSEGVINAFPVPTIPLSDIDFPQVYEKLQNALDVRQTKSYFDSLPKPTGLDDYI